MKLKERYLKAKEKCIVLNKLLKNERIIDNENQDIKGVFEFDDKNLEIYLRTSNNFRVNYFGYDWGETKHTIFDNFKTLGKPKRIFK